LLRNESRGETPPTSYENGDYPKRGPSKYFIIISCIHTTACGAHICVQTRVLYGCNSGNGYDINTLRSSVSRRAFSTDAVMGMATSTNCAHLFPDERSLRMQFWERLRHQHTAHACVQTSVLYGCSYGNSYDINTLRMSCSYITHHESMKDVLRVRLCVSSTAATCGLRLILEREYQVRPSVNLWPEIGGLLSWTLPAT
jgi:hypothetical protein